MLTDIALKALKPAAKPYKRSDGGGLFIFVKPNGGKFWSLGCNVNGKQKFFSGGSYPTVSLREARDWRAAIKAQLLLGLEPNARPKPRKQRRALSPDEPPPDSFEAVALEWYETRLLSWSPRYAGVLMRRMKADIFPVIGRQPIDTITPRQMLEALRAIEKRGSVEMAQGEVWRVSSRGCSFGPILLRDALVGECREEPQTAADPGVRQCR